MIGSTELSSQREDCSNRFTSLWYKESCTNTAESLFLLLSHDELWANVPFKNN